MPEPAEVMAALPPAVSAGEGGCTLVFMVPSGMRSTISDAVRGWGAGWPRIEAICCKAPVGSWAVLSVRMETMVPV